MLSRSVKHNSQMVLSPILENCEEIITVNDLNFNYIACNKAFLNFLDVKDKSKIIHKPLKDILTPESIPIIEKQFQTVIDTLETQTFTFRITNKNCNKIIKQTAAPVIENGLLTSILSVSRDVTQEENLTLKLAEKVCRFNTLLEHIPMLVFMKDKEGKYITGSKCAKDFVDDGVDAYAGNIQIDIKETKQEALQEDDSVLNNKKILKKEKCFVSLDGNSHWYKICKAPIFDNNDNVNGIVTIAQNIDFEKHLEAQKELFLATLTHDLKNPLQAQLMSLKMLNKGEFGKLTPEQQEIMGMVIESATYMQDMLYSILTTYKCENGVIKLEKKDFNADKLMQNCINEVKTLANNKNITINYTFDLEKPELYADSHQLRRVISNLLNNALNYAYNDSTINIRIRKNKDKAVFEFENTSDVIPEQMLEHIFDKYVTGAKGYQKQGIGLGLYFCKKLVEAHNGSIYLKANGNCNNFVFELPAEKDTSEGAVKW